MERTTTCILTKCPTPELCNDFSNCDAWLIKNDLDKPPQTVITNSGDSHAVERSIHETNKKE